MPISCSDRDDDRDGRLFRDGAYPDSNPYLTDHIHAHDGADPVAALAGHARAAGLLYDHSTLLPHAQRLQGLRVEGARDPQPFALLIVTERGARLRTEPPIQWARRKACSL